MDKPIVGIGVLLRTPQDTFLFQERDKNIQRNPGMIAPFGGGIEEKETPIESAIRELKEELELIIEPKDLQEVGIFESHFSPGTYIKVFLILDIKPQLITLHEGRNIKEMNIKEALQHYKVTDFTKEVLVAYQSKYAR